MVDFTTGFLETFQSMNIEQNRFKSFTSKWPHKGTSSCNPNKMARAGFFYVPSSVPDSVCCFACTKELDSWEPSDDPMEEHLKHSKDCPYMKLLIKKGIEDISVEEMVDLDKERLIFLVKRYQKTKIQEFAEHAEEAAKEMETK